MKVRFDRIFSNAKTLHTELRIAFGLIAIAMLVFIGYLFPGLTSSLFGVKSMLHIVVVIALFITVIAFVIILQIIQPIIRISNDAKMIAGGDLERRIEMVREDEIGELGVALNQMTRRIKDNMEDLRKHSQQTEAINREINRRVVMLSSLVEISSLIAQNADLQTIIRAGVEKCLEFGNMNLGALVLKDPLSGEFRIALLLGAKSEKLIAEGVNTIPIKLGKGLIGKTILRQNVYVVDKDTVVNEEVAEFRKTFLATNVIMAPVTSKGNVFGLLIAGNDEANFVCTSTEKEIFHLISKQVAIAVTNDLLVKEIEKLEVTDHLTGLFSNTFTRKRLAEEVKRAAGLQKPCSFLLFGIDKFEDYHKSFGRLAAENILIKIAAIFKESIEQTDKASRFGDHEFALILPGKNKRESIKVADEIRKKIEIAFSKEESERKRLTSTAVITENPIDGTTAEELILKSGVLLAEAMTQGSNRICY